MKVYTEEQIEFLKQNQTQSLKEITDLFNQKFHTNKSISAIKHKRHDLKLVNKRIYKIIMSEKEHNFLKDNAILYTRNELTALFNKTFNHHCSVAFIKSYCQKHKFTSKYNDGKFTSETSPRWQKGLSKEEYKSHFTEESFQKNISPMIENNKTHKIGDIIDRHNQLYIVVSLDYNLTLDQRLKLYSHYVWEQYNQPVPKTHMIIHLDNNKYNCDINNLRCIPTKYRPFLRWNKWWHIDATIKNTALDWCELYYLLKEAKEQ